MNAGCPATAPELAPQWRAPIEQIEFARQSADLLRALHDDARVMHLDLRLDNFVITPPAWGSSISVPRSAWTRT